MATDGADVIVIGAGVIGSAVTFELTRRGHEVVCVDAGPGVGMGSTSSSSAIIRFNYSTVDTVLTAWEAAALWDRLGDHLGPGAGEPLASKVSTGMLMLDFPGSNREVALAHFAEVGVPYEELSPTEIRRRFPALDVGDYAPPRPIDDPTFGDEATAEVGGYLMPDAGFVDDPMLAAQNFMSAARAGGARLRLSTAVVAIRRDGDRVAGVEVSSGDRIDAPVVVNVAGPSSSRVNAMAGVDAEMRITSRPLRQEVHVAPSPPDFGLERGVIVGDLNLGTYFRPHLGGTVLVGSTEPDCDPLEWVDDPDHYDDRPTLDWFHRNLFRLARRVPSVGIPLRPTGLAALYDASDDWVPLYDKTSLGGYYMACGTSGNQFKNAPMVGIFLAELIAAAAGGRDHDRDPVTVVGPRTGRPIDLGAFSRLRHPTATSGTVLG